MANPGGRSKRFERWTLEQVVPTRRRRLFILGVTLATAAASFGLCVLVYWIFDVFPKTAADMGVAYGLPVAAPLVIAPIFFSLFIGIARVLQERTAQLEDEVRRRQKAESRLAILVTTDELTQVSNRRAFFARAAELAEGTDAHATVAVLDLDEFKRLNDSRGHAAGDAVLRQCGEILRELVDINGLASRLGGEEFGLLLPHRDAETAQPFMDELRARIASDTEVTVSIGVADWPAGSSIDPALAAADAALYRAKQKGRNRVELATNADRAFGTEMAPVARR